MYASFLHYIEQNSCYAWAGDRKIEAARGRFMLNLSYSSDILSTLIGVLGYAYMARVITPAEIGVQQASHFSSHLYR